MFTKCKLATGTQDVFLWTTMNKEETQWREKLSESFCITKNSLIIQAKIKYHDYGETTSWGISMLPAMNDSSGVCPHLKSVCVMILCLCLSWSRGMTYKHLHILSQCKVSSLCILPKTHAHQQYLTGIFTLRWPRFNAGFHSASSYKMED